MMERRHYIQVADIIAELQDEIGVQYKQLAFLFAVKLRRNRNFNEERFLKYVEAARKT